MKREELVSAIAASNVPLKVFTEVKNILMETVTCSNCKLEDKCFLAVQVTHRPDFCCSGWTEK